MITKLTLRNFKGFKEYTAPLQRLNLLVGGNNSGKTTLFHALQLVFWCIERTVDVTESEATFRKTQVTAVESVPAFSTRDLFFQQQQQAGKKPVRIELTLETDSTPPLRFEIYRAFSRNMMIDGADQRLSRNQYDLLMNMRPVYIPGTIGITVQEEYIRAISQQRLIAEGRQNQVLRNLLFRLKREGAWAEFVQLLAPLFSLGGMGVPFDMERDEWLSATYQEGTCEFDLVSGGSGFLQTINLLCFLFLHESKTALLDEPDSHMHDDLQKVVFSVLDTLSRKKNLQIIIATHSSTFVDVAGLDAVLLIDKRFPEPRRAQNVDALVPMLADRGLSLPPNKVLETLRTRKALFVEGAEADYQNFVAALGEIMEPGFGTYTRGLKVFEMGGAEKKWPFDAIVCFQELLGAELDYVYLSDRDFLTDEEIDERKARAARDARSVLHLARRHREAYLLVPSVLSKVIGAQWRAVHKSEPPDFTSEKAIHEFILKYAKDSEDDARTDLYVQHETVLRGDNLHRSAGMAKLTDYFRKAYTEPVERNEIPYRLLDSKDALKKVRTEMNSKHKVSFSDLDICRAFTADEIPADLREILRAVLDLFPRPAVPAVPAPPPPSPQQDLPFEPSSGKG